MALSQPGAMWRAKWDLCWPWGYPITDPNFFRSEQQSRGGSWRTRFGGKAPGGLRPSGSAPRRGATCSWAARILPHPLCPVDLVRPRGSITQSPEPAPRSPPPVDLQRPRRGLCGPLPRRLTPLADGPWEGAPCYRLIAGAIRTINNPLAILLTREVGGRKRSSRPALGRPAGPRRWQCQPARQPSPRPGPSPHARPASGRKGAWPPTASSSGLRFSPSVGRAAVSSQPPPSRLTAAGRGSGRGGGGGLGGTRPPTLPTPVLGRGARHTCPRPGLAVQACLAPGVCRAEAASCPGPHHTPPPRPHPGAWGTRRSPEERRELLLQVVPHAWRRERGKHSLCTNKFSFTSGETEAQGVCAAV